MPRIPDAFEATYIYSERTVNQRFVEWINRIIEEKNIDFGVALQETGLSNRKSPDIIIQESQGSKRVICLIELKLPSFDVLGESELIEPASEKAYRVRSPYFATSNVNQLVLFSTQKSRSLASLSDQMVNIYDLTNIADPSAIDRPDIRLQIQRNLERFLVDLLKVAKGKKQVLKRPIDKILIHRLRSAINSLQIHYQELIKKNVTDAKFARKLRKWFNEQGWDYSGQVADLERVARQAAYLLINKIVFYTALQEKFRLDPISIPPTLTDSKILKDTLQAYFRRALDIDYETIFTTDFIDDLAFPQSLDAIITLKEVLEDIKRYRMSKLDYDVIGRIFERLIPIDERHKLGQYFTRSDIVDLILGFCLDKEEDKVFDPACGTGTFLVRAYKYKHLQNPRLEHKAVLGMLWGGDIARFPISLATINLAVRDLGAEENYPGIFQKDFFELHPDLVEFTQPRKVIVRGVDKKKIPLELPRYFDCLVGNPPYTRQEEMEELIGGEGYKKDIIKTVTHYRNRKIADLGKRAGIHAHFFLHGWKFLSEGGRFGFIVSNSWLDVDYGKFLQEFFLKHYKIVAIIESKVERWFEDADINTCIVILEKCSQKKMRDDNLARFVYLKKPLTDFIPPAEESWEKERQRRDQIKKLKKLILGPSEFYENEEIKIYPKLQKELWDEGYDKDTKKYIGSKWGKYIRAPEIFFKILEKGKGKLVPLKEIADVRFGIKTGANEFFYLTEEKIKQWGIEKEFWMHKEGDKWVPNYIIKSPRECKSIIVKPGDLKYRVLMIHKDRKALKGTKVLKYIKEGERRNYHRRPTCASRSMWYDLGMWNKPDLIWPDAYNVRYGVYNTQGNWGDKRFFYITLKDKRFIYLAEAYLNCSVVPLLIEIDGIVNLGEGAVYTNVYWLETLKFLRGRIKSPEKMKNAIKKLRKRKILPIFAEFGLPKPNRDYSNIDSNDVSLNKIEPDRRELDKIVMGDVLGLTDEEQLEVYRAVVDLVSSRIKKARSVGKRKGAKQGVDIDAFVKTVMEVVGEGTLGKFFKEKILSHKPLVSRNLPKLSGEIRIESDFEGCRFYYGKKYILCDSQSEARYLKVWLEAGLESIGVPKDDDYLAKIVPQLEKLMQKIKQTIESHTESIVQPKLRQKILNQLWQRLTEGIE